VDENKVGLADAPSGRPLRKRIGKRYLRPLQLMMAFGIVLAFLMSMVLPALPVEAQTPTLLNGADIQKYETQLTGPPPVYTPLKVFDAKSMKFVDAYSIKMSEFSEQILPTGYPQTKVWGYGGYAQDAVTGKFLGFVQNSPGPSFVTQKGTPVMVNWVNNIKGSSMFAVDPTLMWANPNNMPMPGMGMGMPPVDAPPFPPGYPQAQSPVPLVPHVHGAEVQSTSDGGPLSWFTNSGLHGPNYFTYLPTSKNAAVYFYPNDQEASTIWYHDHAMGMTRLNVMSGLAGFWEIKDCKDKIAPLLPSGKYDIPLAIQDRMFMSDGSMFFPSDGVNPTIHPYWNPEFFGDVIMVNGKAWPNMNVDQGQYRFRVLDGSNARFYNLSFSNGMPFTVIATEGGYLKQATTLTSLLIAPGERYEILVDFSNLPAGTKVLMKNDAAAPYPSGDAPDPLTTAQIMQFTVGSAKGFTAKTLPALLNPTLAGSFPNLPETSLDRQLTLTEIAGPNGPMQLLLDGQSFSAPVSETPKVGTTEDWVIVNPTADTHPIHLHLVQFQLVSRQAFNVTNYMNAWLEANDACGMPGSCSDIGLMEPLKNATVNVNLAPFLEGPVMGPDSQEMGWKDTVKMNPGEVTIIRVRFAQQDGGRFPFDATKGPGYVWHCHIIDHEDNEMMRPYYVTR
jgi:spore coat protein A, manganese oxidase